MSREPMRRETGKLLLLGTLLFAMLLALGLGLARAMPALRQERLERALAASDTRTARRLSRRLDDAGEAAAVLDRCDYLDARAMMSEARWEEAEALLVSLGDYEDAGELRAECRYQTALTAMNAGDWDAAAELFSKLGAYRDAAEQNAECRYRRALALSEAGQPAEAALLLEALGDYRDARQRAETLACELTGLTDPEAALAQVRGLSAEALAKRRELEEARRALPAGCVAAGFYHTLGLRNDGRVLACGDDSFGQCRTEGWTEITAVAAGAGHSLGLRSDGTVVAAGRNDEGQCEVSGWTSVVAVAAGDYASYGLRSDGTVLCAGLGSFAGAESWTGVRSIAAGSYALGAVLADGTARLAPEAELPELTELAALAVNTGCAVGLKSDGTLVSPQLDVSDWTDMLALSLSGTRLLGLDSGGRVRCLSFRAADALNFSDVRDAVALADGGTHVAIAFADGSVRVFGETERGQGDTQDWKLF